MPSAECGHRPDRRLSFFGSNVQRYIYQLDVDVQLNPSVFFRLWGGDEVLLCAKEMTCQSDGVRYLRDENPSACRPAAAAAALYSSLISDVASPLANEQFI